MTNARKFFSEALAKRISRRSALRMSLATFITLPIIDKAFGALPVSTKVTRVGSTSFSLSISSTAAGKGYIEYGYTKSKYTGKSAVATLAKGTTVINVDGLKAESKIYYRLRYALGTKSTYSALAQGIVTTTKVGEDFVFAVQADPHMDENSSADVYS